MKYPLITSFALSLSFGGTAQAAEIMSMKAFPKWFKTSMKREQKVESSSALKLDALKIDAQVLSNSLTLEQGDGFWYVNLNIGTEAPMECYTFSVFDGPANSLHVLMNNAIQGMPDAYDKPLVGKFNFAQDVGVTGNIPYLSVDALYHLGKGKKQLYGLVKGLSAKTGEYLHACVHNELGYRKTFLSVFESYVAAFSSAQSDNAFFRSVHRVTFKGMPVGYVSESYTSDEDGDVATVNNSAVIFPVDESNLTRHDAVAQEWSSPDGELINASTYSVQNSTLASDYSLQKHQEKWQIKGQRKEETLDSHLEYTGELVSDYGTYLAVIDLLSSDKTMTTLPKWDPEEDPLVMSQTELSKISDNSDANLNFDMGSVKMQFLSDKAGIFEKGTVVQSEMELDMELIYSKGTPKQP